MKKEKTYDHYRVVNMMEPKRNLSWELYLNSFRQQVEVGIWKIHTAMTGIQKTCAESARLVLKYWWITHPALPTRQYHSEGPQLSTHTTPLCPVQTARVMAKNIKYHIYRRPYLLRYAIYITRQTQYSPHLRMHMHLHQCQTFYD